MNRIATIRSQKGFTVAAVVFAAFLVLLPVGLYSFEVARSNLVRTQLKASLDAATLAAANTLANESGSSATSLTNAKAVALLFMQRQTILGSKLTNTTVSASAATDSPPSGTTVFDVTQDANLNLHARATYGLRPAFGSFLGITTQPIRVSSGSGYTGLEGDIVVVLDISDSLTIYSKSLIMKRTYNKTKGTLTYTALRNSKRHPALGRRGAKNGIPDPTDYKIDESPVLKAALEGKTDEFKRAFLVEAKKGNLESQSAFTDSHTDKGLLNGQVNPGPGWKEEYQKVAIENVLKLGDEKNGIKTFITQYLNTSPDVHLGLVTFGGTTSGNSDFKDTFHTYSGHGYPHVNLNKSADNKDLVVQSIGPSLSRNGTDMKGGIRKATEMLTGNQHRDGVAQTILLVTDGLPTTGSPYPAAVDAGGEGIKIFAIGYFNQASGLARKGQRVLDKICAKAGNGSKPYTAPTYPDLLDVLKRISHGTLALNND